MKRNFQDDTDNLRSNTLQIGQRASDALDDTKRAASTIEMLARMPKPPEHDLLKDPNLIGDPPGEIAKIKSDLRFALGYLDRAEERIAELRAALNSALP